MSGEAINRYKAPPPYMRGLYPWGRYWAKVIDAYFCGFAFARAFPAIYRDYGTVGLFIASALVFPFVEAVLISLIGTTPGKAAFRISVLDPEGNKLRLPASLMRSYEAWFRGFLLGIPILSIIGLLNSYQDYSLDRVTKWDLRADARFVAQRPNWVSWTVLAVVAVIWVLVEAYIQSRTMS